MHSFGKFIDITQIADAVINPVTEFHGNSSHIDHFKLLKEDGTSVLVGARNIIYNLSLPDLLEYTDQVIQTSLAKGWQRKFVLNLPDIWNKVGNE